MESTTPYTPHTLQIDTWDVIVIVIYFIFIICVGIWAVIRANRGSVSGYFLAGQNMTWFPVGASLYSSNIGSSSFVGLAGTAAASGIAVSAYELTGLFCILLLAWLFVPVYIAGGVYTMPDYLQKRFGGERLRTYLAVLALIQYVFTKISVDMFAGSIFIQQSLGWSTYPAILFLLSISAIFTITGGLKAVIYTDAVQTVIMIAGAVILMGISFSEIGGMSIIYDEYLTSIPHNNIVNNVTCGIPPDDAFHLMRDAKESDFPWPGVMFGITILGAWYFCTDQVLVQRTLAAKNMHHVKGGSVMAGYLKILPLFLIVFPGMISRIAFTEEVACVDPDICEEVCQNRAGCTNIAYAKLVIEWMPTGVRGLMLAAMTAALMSSLTSIFNSSSAIFTIDIWPKIRKNPSEKELMFVGRLFTLVLLGISILWIPVLSVAHSGQLFDYIQAVTGYFAPPVLSCFLLSILWKRTSEPGAFWGLMSGLVVGVTRMALDFGYGTPSCGEEDNRPAIVANVHFLHFAIILFVFCLFVTIVVSFLTKPIPEKKLKRLTFATRFDEDSIIDDDANKEQISSSITTPTASGPTVVNHAYTIHTEDNGKQVPVPDAIKHNSEPESKSGTKELSEFLCGLLCGAETPAELAADHELERRHQIVSIRQKTKWSILVNINAALLICFGVFVWVLFW